MITCIGMPTKRTVLVNIGPSSERAILKVAVYGPNNRVSGQTA